MPEITQSVARGRAPKGAARPFNQEGIKFLGSWLLMQPTQKSELSVSLAARASIRYDVTTKVDKIAACSYAARA
jgi:hypothetical protein